MPNNLKSTRQVTLPNHVWEWLSNLVGNEADHAEEEDGALADEVLEALAAATKLD